MAKLKTRQLLPTTAINTKLNSKMSTITMKKSLIFSALLGYLFTVGVVSGHARVESGGGENSSVGSNNSSIVSDSNNKEDVSKVALSCMCDGGDVPCEKNVTSSDCPNGRVVARPDCSCCFVCAKQLTESCNEKDAPCDAEYGLICGSDQKCQAKSACSDDTTCSNDRRCIGGACADPCKVNPDVCREKELKNGICIVRNHRPICSCRPGQSVNSEKECAPTEEEEATHCENDGLTYKIGTKFYQESCAKVCQCEKSGSLNCRKVEGHPECRNGTIPLSKLGGEMTRACKLLLGHGKDFDGCCVPEQCANVTVPHDDVELQANSDEEPTKKPSSDDHLSSKDGRKFKVTDSPNNLGDDSKMNKAEAPIHPHNLNDSALPQEPSSTTSHEGTSSMQVMILQRTEHSAVIDLPKSDNEAILSIALTTELNKDPSNGDVWKEHKIPTGLPQITLSDLIPNTSYTLKYSVNGKDSSAVQFITNEVGASSSTMATSSSRGGGVGTATGRSMNIDEVSPTTGSSSEIVADSTEASSSEIKPTTMGSSESVEEKADKDGSQIVKSTTGDASNESNESGGSSSVETMKDIHEEDSIASPSSTMSSPVKGCVYNGTTYEVGHEILNGCDEKCKCMETGEVKCMERCSIPMFKKGSFAHDKMCFEEPSGVDECCVIIACARGKPEPRELIPIHPEPCDSVKCGKNARCLGPSGMLGDDENQTNQTLCLCNEGLVGDPYDEVHGCQENATPATPVEMSSPASPVVPLDAGPSSTTKPEGCIFNNQTFEFGDEHFDGCNYKCRCENSGEFTCLPRCNYRRDDEKEILMGCEIQKDPSDSCCEMLVCHGKPLESGTRKDEPTTSEDVCVYKNKTYTRDEKFYDGCESQCMCFTNGDVTCQPRCPPAGPHSGENNCVTLDDPADKCCKVTICGNQTLYDEVMKAEAAKKSTTSTTAEPSLVSPTLIPSDVAPATGVQRSMTSSEEFESLFGKTEKSSTQHQHPEGSSELPPTGSSSVELEHELDIKISMVVPLNSTAMMITVSVPENELATLLNEHLLIRYSPDLVAWKDEKFSVKELFTEGSEELHTVITGLAPGQHYYFKAMIKGFESNAASGLTKLHDRGPMMHHGQMMGSGEDIIGSSMEGHSGSMEHGMTGGAGSEEDMSSSLSSEGVPCKHKEKMYDPGQEFYDGCESYCLCDGKGNVTCVEIDCPKDGRELIDESCVRWEPDLRNFRKEAPFCCPDMICVQHSHCELEDGFVLQNFEEIPHKFTGCDKTCQCLYGNITCHPGNTCPPLSERPPAALKCAPGMMVTQVPMIEDECCLQWACLNKNDTTDVSVDGLLQHQSNINRQSTPATATSPSTDNTSKTHTSHKDSHSHNIPPHPHHHHPHDIHTLANLTQGKDPSFLDVDDDDEGDEHDQIVDQHDYDQYLPSPQRPPHSGGNRPSIVGLDKLNPMDLQEILHHLVNLGGLTSQEQQSPQGHGQGHRPPPPPQRPQHQQEPTLVPGAYTTVHSPQQVAALEREVGGRFVGRAEDGSYIVAVPQPPQNPSNNPDIGRGPGIRLGPSHQSPHGQRPPTHARPPHAPHSEHVGFPGHFPPPPPPFGISGHGHPSQHGGPNDATKVSNILVQPLNESTLQIDFTVSPILVGLHGHVEVLYTKEYSLKPNPAQWDSKVFQQAEDLIDNTHLQLFLTALEPDTDYHMQIRVVVMAQFQPTSDIILVRTPVAAISTTPLPPEILVDPEIKLASSGSRSVKLNWKKLDDDFDSLVDGIQIAYKESGNKFYQTTPLIHRSVTEYELLNLEPNKDYEVNLLFMPFHTDQKTMLKSEKPIFIKTDQEEDEYAFTVALSPGKVSENSVELKVAGVPIPEDKYVSVYQVFYSSDNEKDQKSSFKVPKTETSKRATLTELRPGTKYTIYLEAFLSNGKKKRSNVIDVVTKAGELPAPEKSEQETQESKPELPQTSSYYGALVALAVVAAMSILGIIALLMILIKKQNQAKAPINDRKSESSYDNPSFKSYDVESNGHIKPGEL